MSTAIHFTTNATAPGTVHSLTATVLSSTSVNISWQPPQNGGTYHDFRITITPLYRNGESRHNTTSATSIVISGLDPGAFYLCVLAARTSAGSQHSVSVILLELPPDVPSGYPVSVTAVPLNSRTLQVFWSPPTLAERNGNIIKYGLKLVVSETGAQRTHITRDSSASFVIPNLHPYYHYKCAVTAFTTAGNGPYSPVKLIQMPADVPDAAPVDLTATNGNVGVVTLHWSPPPLDKQNGDIIGYIIKILGLQDRGIHNVTSYDVSGLNASSYYSFSVAAMTIVGTGPFSSLSSIVTIQGVSLAPAGVSAERISATQIRVSWPRVGDETSPHILSYTVKYYPQSSWS
jgi:hypothetical protein